jgi:hypothetical protein
LRPAGDAADSAKVTKPLEAARPAVLVVDLESNELALGGPQLAAEEHRARPVAAIEIRRKSNAQRLASPKTESFEQR